MTVDPNKDGIVDYYNSLVDAGYFDGDINIDEHIDTDIYNTALDELISENPDDEFYKSLKN